jgi:hypothetical protein
MPLLNEDVSKSSSEETVEEYNQRPGRDAIFEE